MFTHVRAGGVKEAPQASCDTGEDVRNRRREVETHGRTWKDEVMLREKW